MKIEHDENDEDQRIINLIRRALDMEAEQTKTPEMGAKLLALLTKDEKRVSHG